MYFTEEVIKTSDEVSSLTPLQYIKWLITDVRNNSVWKSTYYIFDIYPKELLSQANLQRHWTCSPSTIDYSTTNNLVTITPSEKYILHTSVTKQYKMCQFYITSVIELKSTVLSINLWYSRYQQQTWLHLFIWVRFCNLSLEGTLFASVFQRKTTSTTNTGWSIILAISLIHKLTYSADMCNKSVEIGTSYATDSFC